ncbi:leucine-rich repeat protein [Leyella stercorea]|uniref:leucine-rich repeat protein n=1 Tax=Leyella stercorea TaxID=363265 RepID=UPI00248D1B17|nr:leucine-rich repeat protein [Leyella stercorea]
MQYPLISEYLAAIREAHDNLDKLSHLVPVLDKYGEPYRSSGAFAVVFKMKDEQTGKCYALKCFTEEQEGRAEAYHKIAEELEFVDSSYITSVKYLEKELFVDSNCEDEEFPVLLMDWIEGETMETYIAANYTDTHAMSMLCYRFCKMAAWLRSQSFAHGDIKPDNIMVRPDGTLTLVDYDGMFVPAMKGQKSPTIGTKDFSHPLRTIDDFDETIDDFALASIALSLKAIPLNPSLLQTYGASDRLLFSASDYLDLSKSKTFTALQGLLADEEARTLMSMFLLASVKKDLSMCSFRLFGVQKPKEEVWSTKVTKEDIENAIEDEFGVKYSKDWKRLLKAPSGLKGEYSIRKGLKVIGNNALGCCESLTSINIPNSVTNIGDCAFMYCKSLTNINIPNSVTNIGDSAFWDCRSLTSINIPNSVINIGDKAFKLCKSLTNINIPNSVTNIGYGAFFACDSLTNINIPDSVTNIGKSAFWRCDNLPSKTKSDIINRFGEKVFES